MDYSLVEKRGHLVFSWPGLARRKSPVPVTSRIPDSMRLPSLWRHARAAPLLIPVAAGEAQADPLQHRPLQRWQPLPLFPQSGWEGLW
jgi:hypothetical protein